MNCYWIVLQLILMAVSDLYWEKLIHWHLQKKPTFCKKRNGRLSCSESNISFNEKSWCICINFSISLSTKCSSPFYLIHLGSSFAWTDFLLFSATLQKFLLFNFIIGRQSPILTKVPWTLCLMTVQRQCIYCGSSQAIQSGKIQYGRRGWGSMKADLPKSDIC